MNIVFLIIGLVIGVAAFAGTIFAIYKFAKRGVLDGVTPLIDGNFRLAFLLLVFGAGVGTIISSYGLAGLNNWFSQMKVYEIVMLFVGSYLFTTSFMLLVSSFGVYYYRPDLDPKQRKIARIVMFSVIPLIIAGLWILTDSFAPYISYPLPNGVSFTTGLTYPGTTSGFAIKIYGVVIVFGALVSYFVSDHYFYKKFHKHGILDTILIIALPAGILGARLWYVTILEPDQFLNFFHFQDGGLAIQGGALLGIAAGVTALLLLRKYVNIRWAMDIAVPTILLAQAIGRWGNFFNIEVYGNPVSLQTWSFLPKIITGNMVVAGQPDKIYLPLFLIEGIVNIAGYFVIRYAFGRTLRKYLPLGCQAMAYLVWYGLTRVALEPLRYGYQAPGTGGYGYNQSYIMAFIMIGMGLLGMAAFHLYDVIRKKKGLPPRNLDTI